MAKHFASAYPADVFYVEPQERDTEKLALCYELRFDGPMITELNQEWEFVYDANLLIKCVLDASNIYRMQSLVGAALTLFVDIPIMRYGPEVEDDGSSLGTCATVVVEGRSSPIRSFYLGRTAKDVPVHQHCLEATYKVTIGV